MIDVMIYLLANAQDFGTYCIYMCKNLAPIAHAAVSSRARCLKFVLSLHLHPYFVFASSQGTGESVHLHRSCLPEPI